MSEKVTSCFDIENKEESFACVRKAIREETGSCHSRIVLLTQESCAVCAEEKARRQKDIEAGEISVVDVDSEDGRDIVKINELDSIPALIVVDCHNQMIV